jgi:hypothetical protein
MTQKFQQALRVSAAVADAGLWRFSGTVHLLDNIGLNAMQNAGMPISLRKGTSWQTLTGSNAYLKLYEIWTFFSKQFRTVSPVRIYKTMVIRQNTEILDRIFGFDPATFRITSRPQSSLKLLQGLAGFTKPGWTPPTKPKILSHMMVATPKSL